MTSPTSSRTVRRKNGGYFPLRWHLDFLHFLRQHDDVVRIMTYDDLLWEDDWDYEGNYPDERRRWNAQLADDPSMADKVHVVLQHDMDSRPERTFQLLRHEVEIGVPTNLMIFNERVDRRHLKTTGELRHTPYFCDDDYLNDLVENHGFVVGFHSNANERGGFTPEGAAEVFAADVAALRERFDIRYFSPHGGIPGPDGRNNRDVDIPEHLRDNLRWVHNGHTPRFESQWSDGGINSMARDPSARDLRDYVKTWKRGGRYRILTHPQYYEEPWNESPRMVEAEWYRDVLANYESNDDYNAWADLEVPWA